MYITTIYSKLSLYQKNKLNKFLKNNFDNNNNNNNFELEPLTIIIISIDINKITGCVCIYDNKYLIDKLEKNNISLSLYSINDLHGCFIYNLCVHKNYRGKKIGFNLIKYCIEQMKKLNIEYLHTHAVNNISENIFLKNGFIKDELYSPEYNKYKMMKYL